MNKKYIVTLTATERAALQEMIAVGKRAARTLAHARILLKADVREEEPPVFVEDRHSPFQFEFDVTPGVDAPPYTCKFIDAKGATRYRVPITAAQASEPVTVDIPSEALAAGNYTFIVSGTHGVPVLEKRFTVR